jgi:hypothetical protein
MQLNTAFNSAVGLTGSVAEGKGFASPGIFSLSFLAQHLFICCGQMQGYFVRANMPLSVCMLWLTMTGPNRHALQLLFLALSWSLMNRSESTASINFAHITFNGDCLSINQPRSKSDQEGDRAFAKAVFANPVNPGSRPGAVCFLRIELCAAARDHGGARQSTSVRSTGRRTPL